MPPKFPHGFTQTAASFARHHVAMESLTCERSRHRPIRTDQPEIESELLGYGHSKHVPPPRHQHNLDPGGMGLPERREIASRNLKLWIEQRAVDVGCQQPNGVGLRASAFG